MTLARILLTPAIQDNQEDPANADFPELAGIFDLTIGGDLSPQHE
jgi:hypothetical protein